MTIEPSIGVVSGDSIVVSVAATTIFKLNATNANGTTTSATAVVVGQNPSRRDNGRSVSMISPTNGESFIAPTSLRLVGSAGDPFVSTNSPRTWLGVNAAKAQFFVDDTMVLEVDGENAEFNIFKGFVNNIGPGQHRVWIRGIYTAAGKNDVLDSEPMLITVEAAPAYDQVVELTSDIVLSGAQSYEQTGTASKRIRINGNGHRIISSGNGSGKLTLKYVDIFDLGNRTTTQENAIDIATSGNVTIEDSRFDGSNPLKVKSLGASAVSVRGNLFRSNMRQPIGQRPWPYEAYHPSFPVATFTDVSGSSGNKVFAGNNVGAGWVQFDGAKNWLIGGDTDADSNILIGPRVGLYVQNSSNMQVRRNYSHHVYRGGWSEGSNFELGGSPNMTVEHNVIYDSSWAVRGVRCEFRYNLVAEAGHQFLWASTGANIHHNVFVGGQSDVASIFSIYNENTGIRFANNTVDGQLYSKFGTALEVSAGDLAATSNAFVGVPVPYAATVKQSTVSVGGSGILTSDYNLFAGPRTSNYSDARAPAHDVTVNMASRDLFADPLLDKAFDIDEVNIWKRNTTVRDILSRYRQRYTPKPSTLLIDRGDPAGGAGNDIGAVGAGTTNTADKFGLF
jgi:hypothetical protein